MEAQNVSAQVYKKQLPDEFNGQFGCMNTDPYLSTCVKDSISDKSIEDAFQQQLDLSLYYKNKKVFDTMKNDFMSQTMEGQIDNEPPQKEKPKDSALPQPTPANPTVGPRDFLQNFISGKSTFGSGTNTVLILVVVVLLVVILYSLYQVYQDAPFLVNLRRRFKI
jgi:hypothetical protein